MISYLYVASVCNKTPLLLLSFIFATYFCQFQGDAFYTLALYFHFILRLINIIVMSPMPTNFLWTPKIFNILRIKFGYLFVILNTIY
jgi:hypothetical protein